MKKSTLFCILGGMALSAGALNANAQTFMNPATLDYPSGIYVSMAPSSVTITWDNQPIELVNPHLNDWEEECVTGYVKLGDAEPQAVDAAILSSLGNPSDPDDEDVWGLDFALYNLDDIWDFTGSTITVIVPEGIVKNNAGDINTAQEFVFTILPTYTDYTLTPQSGATVEGDDLTVKVSFDGNPIEYMQSSVKLMTYEPKYQETALEFGKEVTVNDANELVIDLSGVASGDYELLIPEGFVFVTAGDGKYLCPDLWLEYTVDNKGGETGIQTIDGETGETKAFTIQGLRVKNTDAKGLLIVNGKKVIVRK